MTLEEEILKRAQEGKSLRPTARELRISVDRLKREVSDFCDRVGCENNWLDIKAHFRRVRVKELFDKGIGCTEIADQLGIGRATVYSDVRHIYPDQEFRLEFHCDAITPKELEQFIDSHPVGSSLYVIYEYVANGNLRRKKVRTHITGKYKHFCHTAIGINPRWADAVIANREK